MKLNKKTLTMGIVFIVVVLGVGSYYLFRNTNAQTSKGEKTTYIKDLTSSQSDNKQSSSSSTSSSSSSSQASSSSSTASISAAEKENISTFLTNYVTYDLTVNSVLERNTKLSEVMTKESFKTAQIQDKSDSMTALVNKWQTTREVDTSNGDVQLVSQKYQSAKVTPDQETKGRYYVELHFIQTPATTKQAEKMVEMLWLTTQDDKVNNVQIISTRTEN